MIKLSASNIGWAMQDDRFVLCALHDLGFKGIEFAPTKISHDDPYSKNSTRIAKSYFESVHENYGLVPCSMQSIWYGISKNLFDGNLVNSWLIDYTKRAIDYSAELNCPNIVFGCPRNRNVPNGANLKLAEIFFETIGPYAKSLNVNFAIEPNPTLYCTNFLNTTHEVVEALISWKIPGLSVNYDIGAAIVNNETSSTLYKYLPMVTHIHLSEPGLDFIKKRKRHNALLHKISTRYSGYISIEMRETGLPKLLNSARYLRSLLDDQANN